MSSPTIVALCGHRGAGKDAIAEILCREASYVNLKFARPLKDALVSIFGLTPGQVDGEQKDAPHPDYGVTPRTLMQWFGTEVMQHGLAKVLPGAGRTFWADRLVQTVVRAGGSRPVVVSDMRFPHESEALRRAFGDRLVVVRVTRPGSYPATADALAAASDSDRHESETSVETVDADLGIVNDGSLEHLRFTVRTLLMFGREYSLLDASGDGGRWIRVRLLRARRSRLHFAAVDADQEKRLAAASLGTVEGDGAGNEHDPDAPVRSCSVEEWCAARATQNPASCSGVNEIREL